jgi:hypothetical protein
LLSYVLKIREWTRIVKFFLSDDTETFIKEQVRGLRLNRSGHR